MHSLVGQRTFHRGSRFSLPRPAQPREDSRCDGLCLCLGGCRRYPAQFGEIYGFDCRAGAVMPPEVTDAELASILRGSSNNGMFYDVETLKNITLITPAVLGYPEATHQSPPTIGLTTLLRALQLTEQDFVVLRVAVGHCGIEGGMLAKVLNKWMDDATHDLVDELFLQVRSGHVFGGCRCHSRRACVGALGSLGKASSVLLEEG